MGEPSDHNSNQNETLLDARNATSDAKAIGRLPDGSSFDLPVTTDLIATLLRPRSTLDRFALLAAFMPFFVLYFFAGTLQRVILMGSFIFFRASYNFGLGMLLSWQSNDKYLVEVIRKFRVFNLEDESAAQGTMPLGWRRWLNHQLSFDLSQHERKPHDLPAEFGTWLLFRHLVDLVLMGDFTSYVCLACSCFQWPENITLLTFVRYGSGLLLLIFNVWVKFDAHRVVTDFAWYWGDFFFLKESHLVFDGVFNVAPHPMYSIGYAFYYGAALITGSYTVFFTSLVAHCCQMVFLVSVENPHIRKTYGEETREVEEGEKNARYHFVTRREFLGLTHFSVFRALDVITWASVTLAFLVVISSESNILAFFITVIIQLINTLGVSVVLYGQSKNQWWTRSVIRAGITPVDTNVDPTRYAFHQWKAFYMASMLLSQSSFFAMALRCWYHNRYLAAIWVDSKSLAIQTIGLLLIALHVWIADETLRALGKFAWFYGDFFADSSTYPSKLRYHGIYRYLDDPAQLLGPAAFWGMAIIGNSAPLLIIAGLVHIGNWAFVKFVERPHMKKRYGELRDGGGVVSTMREKIPHVRVLENMAQQMVRTGSDVVRSLRNRTTSATSQNGTFDRMLAQSAVKKAKEELDSIRHRDLFDVIPILSGCKDSTSPIIFELGQPLEFQWRCPKHSMTSRDWIGVYKQEANSERLVSTISSRGHWCWLPPADNILRTDDDIDICAGTVIFDGDQLPWSLGMYEARYHHDGGHTVVAISPPFVIQADELAFHDDLASIEDAVITFLRKCLRESRCHPHFNIQLDDELFGLSERRAKRVANGIKNVFQVEFDWQVIGDGTVRELAKRIQQARFALKTTHIDKED